MSQVEVCPKCSAHFEGREALVWGGVPLLFGVVTSPGVSTQVRCPRCRHRFGASNLRFFGFISANALRWALVLAITAGVCALVVSSFR